MLKVCTALGLLYVCVVCVVLFCYVCMCMCSVCELPPDARRGIHGMHVCVSCLSTPAEEFMVCVCA
mgnify:CR=1 FL=1